MNKIKYIFENGGLWSRVTSFIQSNHKGVRDQNGLSNFVNGLLSAVQDQEISTGSKPIVSGIPKTFQFADQTQTKKFFSKTFSVLSMELTGLKALLPDNKLPMSVILEKTNSVQMLTRKFIVLMIFGAFLGLFPGHAFNRLTPGLGFERFFAGSQLSGNQLSCFLSYFNHMAEFMESDNPLLSDYVIFQRHHQPSKPESFFTSSMNKIHPTLIISGFMETYNPGNHVLEAIFGNKIVGSATLAGTMHQEEIIMTNAPETLVARIFHANLGDEDVLTFRGLLKFSSYSGYSGSFKYLPVTDQVMYSSIARIYASFDAMFDQNSPGKTQFSVRYSLREMNKLLPGLCEDFYGESEDASRSQFVTGYWGGGVFGGDISFKFIIQLIAACVCSRQLVFSDNSNVLDKEKIRKIEQKYVTCGALATKFFALQHQGRLRAKNTLDELLK
ncbi:Poly(ADP-ribose) glycohydrolase [Cryptosporidium felis]|nr:Poly(ADP-ribose) glycohydrolase [Cryptosporidium felis]